MPQANVSMDVRRRGETVAIIDITGEITAFCESVMAAAHQQATQTSPKVIVLNFEGLEYMNSGGIGQLVTMLIRTQRQKQRLVAFGLTDHYREIFSVTRLDEAIEIFSDEPAALAACGEDSAT